MADMFPTVNAVGTATCGYLYRVRAVASSGPVGGVSTVTVTIVNASSTKTFTASVVGAAISAATLYKVTEVSGGTIAGTAATSVSMGVRRSLTATVTSASAASASERTVRVLSVGVAATSTSAVTITKVQGGQSYSLTATVAGAGAATVKIQVSDVAVPSLDGHWIDAGTITLTLATTSSGDGFALNAAWRWCRANVTAISGTTGTVTVLIGT